jgi:hypothetical protein
LFVCLLGRRYSFLKIVRGVRVRGIGVRGVEAIQVWYLILT